MKKIFLIPLVLLLVELLVSPSAYGQNYNRAKGMARGVAPSRNPSPPFRSAPSQPPVPPATPAPTTNPPAQGPPTAVPGRSRVVEPPRIKIDKEEVLKRTVEFQKKKAEEGSATSQYDLGMRFLKGEGVQKDDEAGLKWLKEAAKNGNNQAIKKLKELDEAKTQPPPASAK